MHLQAGIAYGKGNVITSEDKNMKWSAVIIHILSYRVVVEGDSRLNLSLMIPKILILLQITSSCIEIEFGCFMYVFDLLCQLSSEA